MSNETVELIQYAAGAVGVIIIVIAALKGLIFAVRLATGQPEDD